MVSKAQLRLRKSAIERTDLGDRSRWWFWRLSIGWPNAEANRRWYRSSWRGAKGQNVSESGLNCGCVWSNLERVDRFLIGLWPNHAQWSTRFERNGENSQSAARGVSLGRNRNGTISTTVQLSYWWKTLDWPLTPMGFSKGRDAVKSQWVVWLRVIRNQHRSL